VRVIPVIDVMGGVAVRAVGGRRDQYQPIRSRLVDSTDPVRVALTLSRYTSARELYVADLDAIGNHPILSPNTRVIARMANSGPVLWLDYGHRRDFDEVEALNAGVGGLVLGTETMVDPSTLFHTALLNQEVTPTILSIDLRDGELICPRTGWEGWADYPPEKLIENAIEFGLSGVLLLDLVAVGGAAGPATIPFCRRLRAAFPNLELWTGGGVRDWDDVKRLEEAGADAVLVASALHDGTLTFPQPTS
jgi:phosphoribosylformimino-5-aminoimidazole carboxamide ribotide isomerase